MTVQINGATVAGPFATTQTGINLAPWLTGQAPVDIYFTSATLGRLVIEGTVRAAVTTYAVGK